MNTLMTRGALVAMAPEGEAGAEAAAAAAGADASAAAAAAPAPTAPTWTTGLEPELLGHAQNKGWAGKPADQVIAEVLRSQREAERHIGAPADQLVRLPKEGDAEAAKVFWQRLGAPDDPSKYDFNGIKFSDGTELAPEFVDHVRKTAAELNLPVAQAKAVAESFVKFLDQGDQATATEITAKVQTEQQALDQSWGANKQQNLFVAQRAAEAAGVSREEFEQFSKVPGGAKMLEIFRFFGSKMGEDKFISAPGAGERGAATREQAMAEKAELMKDEGFTKKLLAGDTAALRRMTGLNALITGESGADYQAA